jgi:ADP-ribose pyrophosphatase
MSKSSVVKFLTQDVIYNGWSTLKSFLIEYTDSDGRQSKLRREVFDSGDGSAVLLYDPIRSKILLIRQYRIVAHLANQGEDGWIYECCAGLCDQHDPETAIIKEIQEETGYQVQNVEFLFKAFASPGAHMEQISFFKANYDPSMKNSTGGGLKSENEDIEIVEIDYSDVEIAISNGKIIDQKTIILLQWALMHLINKE